MTEAAKKVAKTIIAFLMFCTILIKYSFAQSYRLYEGQDFFLESNPISAREIIVDNIDYIKLSKIIYSELEVGSIVDGFEVLDILKPTSLPVVGYLDGFYMAAFRKDGDIVIAFRGTNDLGGDVLQNINTLDQDYAGVQVRAAESFVSHINTNYIGDITLTGHSLGGGIAQAISISQNLPAVTLNSAPTPVFMSKYKSTGNNVINIRSKDDPLSAVLYLSMYLESDEVDLESVLQYTNQLRKTTEGEAIFKIMYLKYNLREEIDNVQPASLALANALISDRGEAIKRRVRFWSGMDSEIPFQSALQGQNYILDIPSGHGLDGFIVAYDSYNSPENYHLDYNNTSFGGEPNEEQTLQVMIENVENEINSKSQLYNNRKNWLQTQNLSDTARANLESGILTPLSTEIVELRMERRRLLDRFNEIQAEPSEFSSAPEYGSWSVANYGDSPLVVDRREVACVGYCGDLGSDYLDDGKVALTENPFMDDETGTDNGSDTDDDTGDTDTEETLPYNGRFYGVRKGARRYLGGKYRFPAEFEGGNIELSESEYTSGQYDYKKYYKKSLAAWLADISININDPTSDINYGRWDGSIGVVNSYLDPFTGGYFHVGKSTENSAIETKTGTANYSGDVLGDYYSEDTGVIYESVTGDIEFVIDFDAKDISGEMNLYGPNDFSAQLDVLDDPGDDIYSGTEPNNIIDGAIYDGGSIKGDWIASFYGDDASNIGGGFNYKTGNEKLESVTGIFIASEDTDDHMVDVDPGDVVHSGSNNYDYRLSIENASFRGNFTDIYTPDTVSTRETPDNGDQVSFSSAPYADGGDTYTTAPLENILSDGITSNLYTETVWGTWDNDDRSQYGVQRGYFSGGNQVPEGRLAEIAPTLGSATYSGAAMGRANGNAVIPKGPELTGTMELTADFVSMTMAERMVLNRKEDGSHWGTLEASGIQIDAQKGTFSGTPNTVTATLQKGTESGTARHTINGVFAGSNAEEVFGNWSIDGSPSTINGRAYTQGASGVFVGKR